MKTHFERDENTARVPAIAATQTECSADLLSSFSVNEKERKARGHAFAELQFRVENYITRLYPGSVSYATSSAGIFPSSSHAILCLVITCTCSTGGTQGGRGFLFSAYHNQGSVCMYCGCAPTSHGQYTPHSPSGRDVHDVRTRACTCTAPTTCRRTRFTYVFLHVDPTPKQAAAKKRSDRSVRRSPLRSPTPVR